MNRIFMAPRPPDLGARVGEVEELQAVIGDPLLGEAARRGAQERLAQIANAENAAAAHERAVAQCQARPTGRPCSCGEHPPAVRAASLARQVERAFMAPDGKLIAVNYTPGEARFLAPVPYHVQAQQDAIGDVAQLKVEAHALRQTIDHPRTPLRERINAEARLREVERLLTAAEADPTQHPGAHAQQAACTGSGSRLAVNATSRTTLPCATCGAYHRTPRPQGAPAARSAASQMFVAPVPYWK